jgi:DNA replication protein DnaC
VINDRYEAKKSTILISNLTIQQVAEVLGVRPMDRFREDGSQVLVFAWPSWRRQQSSM